MATGGDTDPNPLYSALDMATIPFHVAAGAYGAQLPFQTATPPTPTSESNASTMAELGAALAIAGRRVTITANLSGGDTSSLTTPTDVTIVVPNGILLNAINLGGFGTTDWTRVRFTKADGDTIGGQIHNLNFTGDTADDLIFDGLQFSSNHAANPAIYPALVTGTNRLAVINNRVHCANSGFGYGATHTLVANNSMRCDANETDDAGDWGFRNNAKGPYIYVDNDIRSNRFSKIRFHPAAGTGLYYAYCARNVCVDRTEGATIDCFDTLASEPYDPIDGFWMLDNDLYVDGMLYGHRMTRNGGGATCNYARVNNNRVRGDTGGLTDGGAADGDDSGNTYDAAPGSDPAWSAVGDPTGIDWTP